MSFSSDTDRVPATGLRNLALVIGLAASAGLAAVAAWNTPQALQALLIGWLFWLGISLGCLSLSLLHNLTGGGWGRTLRPVLDAAGCGLFVAAIVFIPIGLGAAAIYPWADPSATSDPILAHKRAYLNVPFFLTRGAIYFALWLGLSLIVHWGRRAETRGDERKIRRLSLLSGQGLALHALAVTFSSIDWSMSLEPHWFSAIYGVLFLVGQGLAGMAFATALTLRLDWRQNLHQAHQRLDLGNLLLAFTLLWTYMAFSQFLIIWYADLPEEVIWYVRRTAGGWFWTALALLAFHFWAPFLSLLSRRVKTDGSLLGGVALALLVMRWVDLEWTVRPAFGAASLFVPWLDLLATAAVGGWWVALVAHRLTRTTVAGVQA